MPSAWRPTTYNKAMSEGRFPLPSADSEIVNTFFSSVEGRLALGWRREALSRAAYNLVTLAGRIEEVHSAMQLQIWLC